MENAKHNEMKLSIIEASFIGNETEGMSYFISIQIEIEGKEYSISIDCYDNLPSIVSDIQYIFNVNLDRDASQDEIDKIISFIRNSKEIKDIVKQVSDCSIELTNSIKEQENEFKVFDLKFIGYKLDDGYVIFTYSLNGSLNEIKIESKKFIESFKDSFDETVLNIIDSNHNYVVYPEYTYKTFNDIFKRIINDHEITRNVVISNVRIIDSSTVSKLHKINLVTR